MSADILPIDDAGVDETEAIMRSDRARRTGGSFVITTVDEMLSWIGRIRADQATIATLTAERDTAAIDFANRRADTLGDRVVELIREIADARSALAAAEAERDAAVARERERCIQVVGDRIMAARLGEIDQDLRSINHIIEHAIRHPTPTAAQEATDAE